MGIMFLPYSNLLLLKTRTNPNKVQDVDIYQLVDLGDPNVRNILVELKISKQNKLISHHEKSPLLLDYTNTL